MRTEILEELSALQSHYPRTNRTAEEHERWLKDYLDDLGGYSTDAIRYGCREWRKSGARKYPTSGELIALARHHQAPRPAMEGGAWRPLEDHEYQALSLTDKIRHHTILGNQAQTKAGPAFRHGHAIAAEDMPETWHALRARARDHFAEANRLRGHLTRAASPSRGVFA